jgi:hypothetical protein
VVRAATKTASPRCPSTCPLPTASTASGRRGSSSTGLGRSGPPPWRWSSASFRICPTPSTATAVAWGC